ncbi:MAG: GTPase Era [Provencibacterium sp.]|jgi:GTP-binding protein Era|nr:GTPase Era [Provencibacterium sp.]
METKSAFVAIVGRPNVGKSSLMNRLLGEKIAIVTARPQTTRTRITGVLTLEETQLVFTDTPGLHKPKTRLSQYMVEQVNQTVADGDLAVLVTEAQGEITAAERSLLESIRKAGERCVLAVNKVDLLARKELLLERIQQWNELYTFDEVIPLSAKTGEGVDILLDTLRAAAQPSPHFFEEDTLTDQPERVIAAEIIREKLLQNLQDEVPHGVAVTIERMHEREDRPLYDIDATIVCEKQSHKGIVIGKGGAMLKKVASLSRIEMERFLGEKVNLQCWVKVRDDWRQDERAMRQLGFK